MCDLFSESRIFVLTRLCVKIVHIRSFSGPYFPGFGLNQSVQMRESTDQKNSEYRILSNILQYLLQCEHCQYCGWLGQHGSCYNTNKQRNFLNARSSFSNSRPSFLFSFKTLKAGPSVSKPRPSVWKSKPHVLKYILGRDFCQIISENLVCKRHLILIGI